MMVCHRGLTIKISRFLHRLLRPIYDRVTYSETFNRGTGVIDAMEECTKKGLLRPNTLFATLYINNLSTIFPHQQMIETLQRFLHEYLFNQQIQGITIPTIIALVEIFLENQYILYDNKLVYQQIQGSGFQSPLTTILANIFIYSWQKDLVTILDNKNEIFGSHIDGELKTQVAHNLNTEPYSLPFVFGHQRQKLPLRAPAIDIHPNTKWIQNGLTVAGENGGGSEINQLSDPTGLYVDDDQTIYVADHSNHRIMKWKRDATSGQVVAGGQEQGNGTHQLDTPFDLIVDKVRDSLIISDNGNNKVVRWPGQNGTSKETIISNIRCRGLTIDENGSLYVVDGGKHEVRRHRMGDTEGIVMAGGNGQGSRLDQLNSPSYVFVDRDHSVYVSDLGNHRVMKWEEGAKEGIVVAGGLGEGDSLARLIGPRGVVVDQLGTVYVADYGNHRIMRWPNGDTHGSVIAGGNGQGGQSNQLYYPYGISFDRDGNLYVADTYNHRIQKFHID
ncbi:unnamed protein product [Rotaria sordida]|uniref:Uncharacterized protein n=1 Tax=Rotaria sordida TaxID=392033 RepID=A0A819VKH4_9BILA|nr:unnamed protein product [Rotaria sordida]